MIFVFKIINIDSLYQKSNKANLSSPVVPQNIMRQNATLLLSKKSR